MRKNGTGPHLAAACAGRRPLPRFQEEQAVKKLLIALALVTACRAAEPPTDDADSAAPPASRPEASAGPAAPGITGLYEGGQPGQPDQLCIVERAGDARFGLVVWGANNHSCSGAGQAARKGDRLLLRMTGDANCEIAATIGGGTIALPAAVPAECAYYCGARARLDGAVFTRKGATAADAMKAKDLVGESLCG
jgi:hypothetical protein